MARSSKSVSRPAGHRFFSLYSHGFVRVAAASAPGTPADPAANLRAHLPFFERAHAEAAGVLLFPELSLTGYAIDDLHLQDAVLEAAEAALTSLLAYSADKLPVCVVGVPVRTPAGLCNTAAVLHRGRLLGVVPKTFLANYREFYEKRYFAHGDQAGIDTVHLAGQTCPFGADLIFSAEDVPDLKIGVEICEDLWAPTPPSTRLALGGAQLLLNLSASNITIGKAEERSVLTDAQSRRCIAAYVYAAAGPGESTTDLAWDGQLEVFAYGERLAHSPRFQQDGAYLSTDIDLEKLRKERERVGTFRDAASRMGAPVRAVGFRLDPPSGPLPLQRRVDRFPFVPDDPARLDRDCAEAYQIQVAGLVRRLKATGSQRVVIGVSGGLDSTQALIVAARAFDLMGLDRRGICAFTLPGFATSADSKATAWALMEALGVTAAEVSILPLAQELLTALGHPAADGSPVYDITFENVQAGARTDFLFRKANQLGGLVIGTGDLSEAALGWATYGVGDHMSHYNVNTGAPKTLIQHLIRWAVEADVYGAAVNQALEKVLAAEISPELIPAGKDGAVQRTEASIGPYALQDFNLHQIARWGFRPSKVLFLAHSAWGSAEGDWPAHVKPQDRRAYTLGELNHWLEVFLQRFFTTSQFKRSATPNGPKITSGGALSPRGDWRAPSDGAATVWLEELKANRPPLD